MPVTPNPATTEWVPLWDLNGSSPGTVNPHHLTHEVGGTDIVTITALGGFPGGTGQFLRADGTFATPVTGVPGLHHTTHELGGTDVILNNAWTHVTNIFTANQQLLKPTPRIQIADTSQPIDAKIFDIVSTNQTFVIQAISDAAVTQGGIALDRLGHIKAVGVRPSWELQYLTNDTISRISQVTVGNDIAVSSNLFFDGSGWNADIVPKVSALYLQQDGIHYFYHTPITVNPRTLIQLMVLSTAGAVIPAGLGSTPLNASNLASGTVPLARLPTSLIDQATGTWTPFIGGIGGDSGDQTYQVNSQQGVYIRTGRLVHLWSFTQFTSKGTFMISELALKNFPFPVGSSFFVPPPAAGSVAYYTNLNTSINTSVTNISCYAPFTKTYALLKKHIFGANNPLPMDYNDINNGTQFIISISYYID